MNRIGVWGDSITWGASDLEMGGWVARLRHFIDTNYELEPGVYNLGVSGDKVSDVLKRFDVEYEARKPDTVILAIGINDSPHDTHKGTPLATFEQQFTELVQKVKTKSDKLFVVGPTNVDEEHSDSHGYNDKTIKPYEEIIREVTKQQELPYIDLSGLISKDDLKMDGLHPEAEGHEKIFQKVKKALGYN